MMRPKTDNSITDGSGNAQIGHNTGEIHIGLTFEQHQKALKEALKEKTEDLERAHGAERDRIRREADELRVRLAEVEKDYQDRLEELRQTKAELAKYQNRFEKEKFDAANAALDRDDSSLAEALFKELLEASQARREDAERDEASLHFRLGKIAEDTVRWGDAYTHYANAARLDPSFENLRKAREYAWRAGQFADAHRHGEALLELARKDGTQKQLGLALNDHALTVEAQGRYAEAEGLYRKALEIGRTTIGEGHANYAIHLGNLAGVAEAQGRYEEAEGLYREALEIDRATIGEGRPQYAKHLSNLAGVVKAQGRYAEAEGLYREALEIDREGVGEGHPDFATHLNNLANVVREQGRYAEAEGLYRDALEIDRATIGEGHPFHATHLNNLALTVEAQGRYAEAEGLYRGALAIDRATIGEGHPGYATHLNNLALAVLAQGRYAEAEGLFREVLEIARATIGEGHPAYATHLNNLAGVLVEQGKPVEA